MELIRLSRLSCSLTCVTIFVNPTQFGPGEDFGAYPRETESDIEKCRSAGADFVFIPTSSAMYMENHSTFVEEQALSMTMCGVSRPTHFRGVTTIVLKLFNIVQPDIAVFGQKDAQQVRIIKRMVRDLNIPVDILTAPTVRDADGLALSSRNKYLSPEERKSALSIYAALQYAHQQAASGKTQDLAKIRAGMEELLAKATPPLLVEYICFADNESLKPLDIIEGPVLTAIAVRIGKTRLIDNMVILPPF